MADNPIKIEQSQANTWAQELTLKQLLERTDKSLEVLIQLATKMGVASDDLQHIETGLFLSNKNADQRARENNNSNKNIYDQFGKKSSDNITALQLLGKTFGVAFKSLSTEMSSNNPAGILSAFSNGLKSNNYFLTQLSGTLPKVLINITAVTEAFVEMSKTVIDINQKYMESLSNGIKFDDGLIGLNKAAGESGLGLEKYLAIINKSSAVFAQLGSVQVTKLSKQFTELTRNGSELQMTQTESTQGFMDYLEIQRNSGRLTKLNDQQLVTGGKEFLSNINELSRLSGKSRDELIKQAHDISKDPLINALLAGMPPEAGRKLQDGLTQLGALPADVSSRLKNVAVQFAAGGQGLANVADQNYTLLAAQSNTQKEYMDLLSSIKDNKNVPEALKAWNDAILKSSFVQGQNSVALAKAYPEVAKSFGELRLAAAGLASSQKQLEDANKAAKDLGYKDSQDLENRNKARNTALGDFNKSFSKLSAAFNDLALKIIDPILIPTLEYLSKAVDLFTSTISEIGNKLAPFGDLIGYTMSGFSSNLSDTSKGLIGLTLAITGLVASVAAVRLGFSALGGLFSIFGIGKGGLSKLPVAKLGGLAGASGGAAGEALGGLGSGIGAGLGGIIKGIGSALAALGPESPMILAGAAAIGGSITLIGAGIAGATWLLGAALPKMAEGLNAFSILNGKNLEDVGSGMLKLGAGMALLGACETINAFNAVANSILKFFGVENDPIEKLKRFGEIVDPLNVAGPSLLNFATAFKTTMDTLSQNGLTDGITKGFDQLKEFLTLDFGGLFSSQPKIIGQITSLSDAIGALSKNIQTNMIAAFAKSFTDAIAILQNATITDETFKSLDKLSKFLDNNSVLDQLKNFLSSDAGGLFGGQPKIIGQITDLATSIGVLVEKTSGLSLVNFATSFRDAVDIMQKANLNENIGTVFDQIKSILGSDFSGIFGGQPRIIGQINELASSINQLSEKSTDLTHVTNINNPKIDNTDLQKRTLSYYDNQKTSNDTMIALLSDIKNKLDMLNNTNADGHDDTVRAIKSMSNGIVY